MNVFVGACVRKTKRKRDPVIHKQRQAKGKEMTEDSWISEFAVAC